MFVLFCAIIPHLKSYPAISCLKYLMGVCLLTLGVTVLLEVFIDSFFLLFAYSWFMQRTFQLIWLCTVEWLDDKWMKNWCPGSDRDNVPAYDGLEEMDRSTKTLSHVSRFVGLETTWLPVQSQASPYGTCDRQMTLGQVFLRVLWFSPVSIITPPSKVSLLWRSGGACVVTWSQELCWR
jgi:hypothetical protein